ncbi:MAG: DNA repair protein RadA [Anaerolineales bacterium]|nr:DNA repair protein RadA [Anaerolineales bacterium]
MAKPSSYFECSNCGKRSPRSMGRCSSCGEWNTFVEVMETPAEPTKKRGAGSAAGVGGSVLPHSTPQRLRDIPAEDDARWILPVPEFSRVLGGGIVPGSIVLVGGDPGIGKSTLLTQIAAVVAETVGKVLYVSGEESVRQIKMRAERLNVNAESLYLVTETNLEAILNHAQALQPHVMIVDSIQTTYSDDKPSSAGTVTQIRECTARLQAYAKNTGTCVFLVGHVTKEGVIAGPRVLEHIVDTVLYLEGDSFQAYRLLRSVKNRFGATSEVGVFEMRDSGMVEVTNPSEVFLAERLVNAPGSAIVVTMEGTRPLLVEVQALASETAYPNPRRTANGVDTNRLQLVTAVLARRVGIKLFNQDIFVNVIGGLAIDEPAADLAVAVAIASSVWDRPIPADIAIIGEIGLSGELRAVSQLSTRLREAAKLGFKRCLIPKTIRRGDPPPEGIVTIPVRRLIDALDTVLPREGRAKGGESKESSS